jgi:hypothetical protein
MTAIALTLTVAEAIPLTLSAVEPIYIEAEGELTVPEADPIFQAWLAATPPAYPSDMLWEADGLTEIKPKDDKKVSGDHITGTISGGLFQP